MLTALLVASLAFAEAQNIRRVSLLPKEDNLPKVPDVHNLQYVYILVREGHNVPEFEPLATDLQYNQAWGDLKGKTVKSGDRLMKFVGRSLRTRYDDFLGELDRGSDAVFSYTDPLEGVRGTCDRLRQASLLLQEEMFGSHYVSDLASLSTHRRCYGHLDQCLEYQVMKQDVSDPDKKISSVAPSTPFTQLRENYRLFTIENFERAMDTNSAVPKYLEEMAAKYANRITRGYSNMNVFTLGRLYHDMYLDYTQGVRMRIHVTDDLLASAFLSDLSPNLQFAQFGDAIILEIRKLGIDGHFIQAYQYTPLQEQGNRFQEISKGGRSFCSRYLRLNPIFHQCPLKYFMCDHEPSSLKNIRKICRNKNYVSLTKVAYRETCERLSEKLTKMEIEL